MADINGLRLLPLLAIALLLTGCLKTEEASRGVYLVADVPEGDVAVAELGEVVGELLSAVRPGDALAVERAESGVRDGMYLDGRPSRAVAQVRALSGRLEEMAEAPAEGGETDNGLVDSVSRGIHFLDHPRLGRRLIILFTNLQGEEPQGLPGDLAGYDFVAINSDLWRGGSNEAWAYLRRIDAWQRAVESRGGNWRVVPMNGNLAAALLEDGR